MKLVLQHPIIPPEMTDPGEAGNQEAEWCASLVCPACGQPIGYFAMWGKYHNQAVHATCLATSSEHKREIRSQLLQMKYLYDDTWGGLRRAKSVR